MGILDGFVGKVGTVVGSFWKGKKVMRGYNEFPANPRTDKQQLRRKKFALLDSMAGGVLNAIHVGLKDIVSNLKSTAPGEFVRVNYGAVTGATPAALEIDYENIKLSQGNLTPVATGETDFSEPLKVSVPIEDGYIDTEFNSADDLVYLAVYNKRTKHCVFGGSAKRSDEKVQVTVPGFWQGDYVETYVFVVADPDSKRAGEVSDTLYCGEGRVA